MKRLFILFAVALMVHVLVDCASAAEPERKSLSIKATDGVVMIDELGAVLIYKDGTLSVQYPGEAGSRPEKYREVDLKEGDQLLMINGSKITTLDRFESNYEIIEAGSDVKLGIRRDGDMMIITFPKAEEGELPEKRMMMVTMEGDSDSDISITELDGSDHVVIGAEAEEIVPLIELGLILSETEHGLEVSDVMPNLRDATNAKEIVKGDRLVSINDIKITSSDEYGDVFDSLKPGDEVQFVFSHEGKNVGFTHIKKENQFKIIKQSH